MTENPVSGLAPFHAMEILSEAKRLEAEGKRVLHLEFGEPSMGPSPQVIAAARAGLDAPQKYTLAKGITPLRKRLALYYAEAHGVAVSTEDMIVTTGSSAGFLIGFLTCFAPGARIAVTRPGYPAYLNILNGLNYQPVEIAVSAENGWRLTADDVRKAHAASPFEGLLFASPENPTGAVVGRAALKEIVDVCAELGVQLISDEIYHGLEFEGRPVSALEFTRDAVIVNSFSKYYCMTGWRLGWMVLPERFVRKAEILQQNMFISAPSLSQTAALAALDSRDYCEAQKAVYARNRDLLRPALKSLGFSGASHSDGAFYAYVDASAFTNDSMAFCMELLRQTGVATTPGIDFDRRDGNRFVRFSYAGSTETIAEALEKMAGFLTRP